MNHRLATLSNLTACSSSRALSPRDFDISPYFMVVKPTLARGFNYKDMHWANAVH
jgi:hypothetical protein